MRCAPRSRQRKANRSRSTRARRPASRRRIGSNSPVRSGRGASSRIMLALYSRRPMRFHSVWRGARAAVGSLALLAACGGREGTPAPGGGTVIIGTAQDPQTLFPPNADNIQARAVTELIFQRLADRGASLNTFGDGDFIPRLARQWDWSADSLRVTFHIDPRARWQDGRAVSVDDVKFGFEVFTDTLVGAREGGVLR